MKRTLTILIYVITVGAALHGNFLLMVPFAIWFSMRASAGWLIPMGFLIDGYFGAFNEVPLLTIWSILLFLLSEWARPYLLWQNEQTL